MVLAFVQGFAQQYLQAYHVFNLLAILWFPLCRMIPGLRALVFPKHKSVFTHVSPCNVTSFICTCLYTHVLHEKVLHPHGSVATCRVLCTLVVYASLFCECVCFESLSQSLIQSIF
eukprot:m.167152 g.167152  ORF g.167152 m.167152 type:complete len:116 (+) comp14452_c0_seq3:97-444(+)